MVTKQNPKVKRDFQDIGDLSKKSIQKDINTFDNNQGDLSKKKFLKVTREFK